MWGSQEKNQGQKVNETFFRVNPGKKIRNVKNNTFRTRLFRKTEAIFGRFGNFPTTLGVWGILENCQTFKNGISLSKQTTNQCGNISDAAGLPQSRQWILEWSNRPEILDPGLKLEFMDILFSTFYHFDQPLPGWRPPVVSSTLCQCVAGKIMNATWDISNILKSTSWFRGWKLMFDLTHSHTGSFRKNGKSKTFFTGTKFREKFIFSAFFCR